MLALTHLPSPSLDHGQRTHVARVSITHDLAVRQHGDYCQMLRDCGAQVRTLDVNRFLPDSTFIEDTAIVLDEVAVLTSMGTQARRGELAGIETELRKYRELVRVEDPARLEGGDVLRVGRSLLVGLSSRTDSEGVRAFEKIAHRYGYRVLAVPVRQCLHLKTACTALPDRSLLVNPCWVDGQSLAEFEIISVPESEPWAANTLTVAGTVCLAAEHVQTAELLRRRGFPVRTAGLSEFLKAEGGVTCLSLLFS
ncbi:MAG TPA: arginine deiminase family protein [Gemmataceae bacterium]|nr:arginine deiminase family protein [Gemmataceae bacterium]